MKELNGHINDIDNGFITSTKAADLLFEAKMIPAIEGDENPQITVHVRINRNDGGSVLDIGNATEQERLEREGYLAFEIKKDVFFVSGEQVVPSVFSHYERNYGLKPSLDIVFKFPHFEPSEDVQLNYRDELFGQGLIKIDFNKELFTKCYVEEA